MQHVLVFCASSSGVNPQYQQAAREVGYFLADQGCTLVYGGGKVGLMGAVADAVLQRGGRTIGVIPRFLADLEKAHEGLTQLILVESMHERKLKMSELADGVLTLPGGFGTLEELAEMLTWSQLQLHHKPIGIYNVLGYYDHLLNLFLHMEKEGLLDPKNRKIPFISEDLPHLFAQMNTFTQKSSQDVFRPERT